MLKIKKIYHLSDIHIRNFKRHAEYNRVFQKVADYIRDTKTEDSLICITGDIVHSKTDITPELVQQVQGFFRLMSSLLPVVIIPGNHDANLNNNDRLDSLSPIINAMADSNITYLRDTGVYHIGGIDFVHWSVFDSMSSYIKASDVESEYKICLYHGAVNGAYTDLGFELTGNSVSPSDFDGFDIALLGDIHIAAQFMNRKKTAAYPGSLIQQDHGESLDHGLLVWDLDSRSAEFVRIDNDTAFYTLELENGIYEEIPEEVPVNLYLKIKAKNSSPAQIKSAAAEVKLHRNVIELSQQLIRDTATVSTEVEAGTHSVRDSGYQSALLSDYLKQKFDLSQEDIQSVCDLNQEINKRIVNTDLVRSVQWSPKRFAFSNMFSYGKGNVINFEGMHGSYGMFAKNASGKSSAIEALVYCLFDKSSKTNKAGMVMNNRSREFDCRFDFELNERVYTIERRASFRSNTDSVKQDVSFYYTEKDGTVVSLNGKDRADTNASIRSVIGTYDDFVLTSMSMQNNNTGFIDMGQTERKDLLSQFLDIKVFEDLNKVASEDIKEYSALIKEYKKHDHFTKLKELEVNLKSYSVEYRELEERKGLLEKQVDESVAAYVKVSTKLIPVDSDILDIDRLNQQKKLTEDAIQKLTERQKAAQEAVKKVEMELKRAEDAAQKTDKASYNSAKTELKEATDRAAKLTTELNALKYDVTQKLEKMKKLEDLKYDPNCKYCMDNVFVKDAIATRDSIETDKENAKRAAADLARLQDRIKELDGSVRSYEAIQGGLDKIKGEMLRAEADLSRIDLDMHKGQSALGDVDRKIGLYTEKQAAIESNKKTKKELDEMQQASAAKKAELAKTVADIMTCNANIQLAESEMQAANKSIESLKVLEEKYKYYEHYLAATGRDGLPYNLISTVIPKIQTEINNILAQIVEFTVSMESDGKNINAFIVYDETKKWPIELASGMEKFISSLAIRSALISMTSLPRPNFLVIDEGWGALDGENLQNVSVLMDYLKTQFKFVIIISHIDSIKDIVDHQISVDKKKDGFSRVVHG